MTFAQMESYLPRASEFSQYKINSIAITDKNFLKMGVSSDRQSILIPILGEYNFTDIQNYLKQN
ncbi:TPA: hypothetical protein DD455_03140 [Candidatus Shapirobacteria bacterium]|nr:hypothetical protein [Candidatus Shapirobacteria bacterium]